MMIRESEVQLHSPPKQMIVEKISEISKHIPVMVGWSFWQLFQGIKSHTHTHTYIYIISIVCMYIRLLSFWNLHPEVGSVNCLKNFVNWNCHTQAIALRLNTYTHNYICTCCFCCPLVRWSFFGCSWIWSCLPSVTASFSELGRRLQDNCYTPIQTDVQPFVLCLAKLWSRWFCVILLLTLGHLIWCFPAHLFVIGHHTNDEPHTYIPSLVLVVDCQVNLLIILVALKGFEAWRLKNTLREDLLPEQIEVYLSWFQ